MGLKASTAAASSRTRKIEHRLSQHRASDYLDRRLKVVFEIAHPTCRTVAARLIPALFRVTAFVPVPVITKQGRDKLLGARGSEAVAGITAE